MPADDVGGHRRVVLAFFNSLRSHDHVVWVAIAEVLADRYESVVDDGDKAMLVERQQAKETAEATLAGREQHHQHQQQQQQQQPSTAAGTAGNSKTKENLVVPVSRLLRLVDSTWVVMRLADMMKITFEDRMFDGGVFVDKHLLSESLVVKELSFVSRGMASALVRGALAPLGM